MRQSVRSTVSTATTTSSTSSRCVRVSLLNEQHITVFIERKAKVQEVFSQVCEQLGLRETEYFGLAQHIDDEYYFVELDAKLDKLVPSKTWRASRKFGDDNPVLTLYFRVQYYIEHISLLKEKVTRHWYYHQLKDNLLNYRQLVGEEKCFLLAAYSLQADHGNYNCQKHTMDYFDPNKYFPAWVVSRRGRDYIVENMPTLHRDCNGMSRLKALMHFIHEISMPPFAHNLHFYKLKKKKVEELGTAWLGLCPKGIEIYGEENGFKSLLSTFLWNDVGKLFFEKKKFEIRAAGAAERKFTYYTGSDTRSKYLLGLCRGTHQFEMSMQPKLAKIRYMEAEDRNREMCVSSDGSDLSRSRSWRSSCRAPGVFVQKPNRQSPAHTTPGQRTSLYSNVSSNATSDGVVERIMASLETGDRRSQEIMIDTPPHPPTSMHFVHNLSPLVSTSAVTSSISVPPTDRRSVFLGASAMTPVVTTQSTPTKCQKNPVSKPLSTNSASVSRSSSDQSQKSAKLTTMAVVKDPPANLSSQPAMPKPAEAHIQRVTLVQSMTVSSTRVPPGVGGVMGNVAISSSQAVRDFAIPVITASPTTSINNARPGDNLVVPALPAPYTVTPISNISPASASVPAMKPSQHTVPALSALAAVERHSAIYHPAISDSPVSLANNIIPGSHKNNNHKTFEDHTYVNGDMMSQALNASAPAQFPLQPLSMSSLPQLNTQVDSYRSPQPVTAQYGGDPRSVVAANSINSATSSQFLLQQTTQAANLTPQQTKLPVSTQQQYNVTSQPSQSLPAHSQSQHFMPAKHTNNNYQCAGIPAQSVNQLQYGIDSAPSMTVNGPGDMSQFLMQQYGVTTFPQSTNSFQDQSIVQPPYTQQVEQPSYTQIEPSTQGPGISNSPASQSQYMVQQVNSSNLPAVSTQFKQKPIVDTPVASQQFTVNIDSQTVAPGTSLTVLPPSSRAANNIHQAIASRSTNDTASSNRSQQAPPYHLPEAAHAATNLQEVRGAKRLQAGLRRSTHEDCPQHGVRSNIVAEIRGRGSNNKTPLLSALCNDKTLVDTCTCEKGKDSDKLKRMSYSHPTPTTLANEPGTVMRPMSWHSEHFNLDQSLQVYDILNFCNNRANGAPPAYGQQQQQCTPNRGWPSTGNVACSQDVGLEQPNGSVPVIPFSVNS